MSEEMLSAMDRLAWKLDLSRSGVIRAILAEHLRKVGQMQSTDPTTTAQGQNNPHFRPRRGRT